MQSQKILLWCKARGIYLSPCHISGKDNLVLKCQCFSHLWEIYGTPLQGQDEQSLHYCFVAEQARLYKQVLRCWPQQSCSADTLYITLPLSLRYGILMNILSHPSYRLCPKEFVFALCLALHIVLIHMECQSIHIECKECRGHKQSSEEMYMDFMIQIV